MPNSTSSKQKRPKKRVLTPEKFTRRPYKKKVTKSTTSQKTTAKQKVEVNKRVKAGPDDKRHNSLGKQQNLTRWAPGQTGNAGGKTALQRQTEIFNAETATV